MNKLTKLLFWLWLAVTLAVFASRAKAQTQGCVNVVFSLTDFIGNPQAVQRLCIIPLPSLPPGIGTLGSNILIPVSNSVPTGLNGTVTVSNVVTGYPYLIQLQDQSQPPNVIGQWTNFFATNLTGTVSATTNLGYYSGPVFGWVFATNNYVTVAASNGIAFATNGGVLFISATNTNSGGGSGSSFPFLLNPASGLSYTVFLTNDNGVETLQVGTNGYNIGTSNVPPTLFSGGMYYPLFLTNDNGVLTIMVSSQGY